MQAAGYNFGFDKRPETTAIRDRGWVCYGCGCDVFNVRVLSENGCEYLLKFQQEKEKSCETEPLLCDE